MYWPTKFFLCILCKISLSEKLVRQYEMKGSLFQLNSLEDHCSDGHSFSSVLDAYYDKNYSILKLQFSCEFTSTSDTLKGKCSSWWKLTVHYIYELLWFNWWVDVYYYIIMTHWAKTWIQLLFLKLYWRLVRPIKSQYFKLLHGLTWTMRENNCFENSLY